MNGESAKEFKQEPRQEPSEATTEAKQKQQREVVRRWFEAHPNYQREYQAKQKRLRAELGTALNGTIPVKMQKMITYSVTVTRPLKPEEKVQRDPPKKKHRRNHNTYATQFNNPSTHEDDDW